MKKYLVQVITPNGNDGFLVCYANSPEDAIATAKRENPTYIVLDAYPLTA